MSWFSQFLVSSIGRKFVMAFTGLFLIVFLVVHCYVNAMIFYNDNGVEFNKAAHFMGTNPIIRFAELGLFAGLLLHIIQGLLLWSENRKRRPINYNVTSGNVNSTWYSRSMGLLGTLILLFLILHLAHFWVPSRFTGLEEIVIDGKPHHNLYIEMQNVFKELWVVVIYVLGVLSLAYHLLHGFQSSFQTIGWRNGKYKSIFIAIGTIFAILIPLVFASMPIAMYLGWIQ